MKMTQVAIEELKVGDTLSAQVAAMFQADLLVLLTDVDGLYTANPSAIQMPAGLGED